MSDLSVVTWGDSGNALTFELLDQLGATYKWSASTKPTVTITNPPSDDGVSSKSTITDTTRPFISWDYLDPENDAMAEFTVAIFDQGTYENPYFDPATSSALWKVDRLTPGPYTLPVGAVNGPPIPQTSYSANVAGRRGVYPEIDLANHSKYRLAIANADSSGLWSDWVLRDLITNYVLPNAPTIVATGEPANARNRIDISGVTAGAAIVIERLGDDALFHAIRSSDPYVIAPSTAFSIYDYEMPLGKTSIYHGRTISNVGQLNHLTSDPSSIASAAPTVQDIGGDWWIKVPKDTSKNYKIIKQRGFKFQRRMAKGIFDPMGSPEAIVLSDGKKGYAGDLAVYLFSGADYKAIQAILDYDEPVLLQNPTGIVNWYVAIDTDVTFDQKMQWTTDVATTNVGRGYDVTLHWTQTRKP